MTMTTWVAGYWEGVFTGLILGGLIGAVAVAISYHGLGALAP